MSGFRRWIPIAVVIVIVIALAVRVGAQNQGLANTSWQLVRIQNADGTSVQPEDPAKYTIEFDADGRVAAGLNCNRGAGTWKSASPEQIEFGPMAVTTAACLAPSLDARMAKDLTTVHSYAIENGHLHLNLATGGYYEFEPHAPAGLPQTHAGLAKTSWQLVQIHNADGTLLHADDPTKYTVEFGADGTVIARLDCNRGHGTWKSASPGKLELSPMAVTRMMCLNPSFADRMAKDWSAIQSYSIGAEQLLLMLPSGAYYEFETSVQPAPTP